MILISILINILPTTYELNRTFQISKIFITKPEKVVVSFSVSKCSLNTFSRQHQNVSPFIGSVISDSDRIELFNYTSNQNGLGVW